MRVASLLDMSFLYRTVLMRDSLAGGPPGRWFVILICTFLFLKDFILINILIKIHTSTLCLDFILIEIHLSALSGGHAGATTSPAEDSEADGGAPF